MRNDPHAPVSGADAPPRKRAASPWRLSVYESLGSTSDLVLAAAQNGEDEGLAVLALQQTAGRGSRGRGWTAPSGNLNLSVLLRPSCPAGLSGHYALLAGIALFDAFMEHGARDVALKWPNDVLLNQRKLAGILIDSAVDQAGRVQWLVIGMGANLAAAPDLPGRSLACLAEIAQPAPSPQVFASSLLDALWKWDAVFRGQGVGPIREAWLQRAQPLGSELIVTGPGLQVSGRFAGLSEDGALLLEHAGGITAYSTGDILLPTTRREA